MIVPARPLPTCTTTRGDPGRRNASPWLGMTFFSLGRIALLAALRRLGLRAGDMVVFPAYYCESTLGVIRDAGFRLDFVDLKPGYRLDVESVAGLCEKKAVKALVVVHFFGFRFDIPDALRRLCAKRGIWMIEDFGHSFLSFGISAEGEDRRRGDACIFSMRKVLPVPDGGALWMAGAHRGKGGGAVDANHLASRMFLVRSFLEKGWVKLAWPNLYGMPIDRLRAVLARVRPRKKARAPVVAAVEPSALLARQLGDETYLRKVSERRRRNYAALHARLAAVQGIRLFPLEVADWVPQALPVQVRREDDADRLLRYLRNHGIGAYSWPGREMPPEVGRHPERYPVAIMLNRKSICLPVHQDLATRHIDYMGAIVRRYFEGHAG